MVLCKRWDGQKWIAAFLMVALGVNADRQIQENGAFVTQSKFWKDTGQCPPSTDLELIFTMTRSKKHVTLLEQTFWDVSNPESSRYGQYLSPSELKDLVGATPMAVQHVADWLRENNASTHVTQMQDAVIAKLTCSVAEKLLETEIHGFTHKILRNTLYRSFVPYSLPEKISAHVTLVSELSTLPRVYARKVQSQIARDITKFPVNDSCGQHCGFGQFVTPEVISEAYQLGKRPQAKTYGSLAVAEFQGQMWDQPALDKFSKTCQLNPAVNVSHQVGKDTPVSCRIPIVGSEACIEAMLDIEYAGSVAGAIPLTNVYNKEYSLLKWAHQVMDLPHSDMPLVHSVSYGNDELQQISKAYMDECNVQFQKFGVLGLSVLFASGDQGVWGREGHEENIYHPDFPAASPFVTAVGGTDFAQKTVIGPEKAWQDSGGGFSNIFSCPEYQKAAIDAYFEANSDTLPPSQRFNRSGRGYPDISALGGLQNPYCVIVSNLPTGVAGTSASTPVFAGVVAKLNEIRLEKGKAPLGFLNPWIYKVGLEAGGTAFHDVTIGRNCGGDPCRKEGFAAAKGWDPATGFGTPNFEELAKLV